MTRPDGWQSVTLGAITRPITDRAVPDPEASARFIGMEHVASGTGHIARMGYAREIRSSSPVVLRGDVLYGRLRPYLNKVTLAPTDAYASGEFIVFRETPGLTASFLRWRLAARDFVDFACSLNTGDRPRVKWPQMRAFELQLPPIEEQRRIVDILEDHLSRLDAADRSVGLAGRRVDRLLQAHLTEQLRQLRDDNVPMAAIGDVAQTSLGKMLDAKRAEGELTPYLANINVRWGHFDLAGLKEVRLTTDERARLSLEPGDVLACEGGEPGRCAVWQLDGSNIAYQKALHRVRVNDARAVSPHFLALMLREAIQSGRSDSLFTGTTIKHLPQEKLRRICVPMPSSEVQARLVADTDRIADAARELRTSLETSTRRSAALRRALLAAAFSGKLTERHTDQDVMEELAHAE